MRTSRRHTYTPDCILTLPTAYLRTAYRLLPTAYCLLAYCLLPTFVTTDYPDNFEISDTSGRKRAITMKPTMPPRMTIMIGSSRLTKLSTAVSTSSS